MQVLRTRKVRRSREEKCFVGAAASECSYEWRLNKRSRKHRTETIEVIIIVA